MMKLVGCLAFVTASSVDAFAPNAAAATASTMVRSATMFDEDNDDFVTNLAVAATTTTSTPTSTSTSTTVSQPPRPVMSTALPFLPCPAPLHTDPHIRSLAGNVGFDPLRVCATADDVWHYRHAEIKHARLAMLAAVGWPLSERLDGPLAEWVGRESLLDEYDRVPSVLNGGLDKVSPVWWGVCLGLTAAIDLYGTSRARNSRALHVPGDLGFDPMGLYPDTVEAQAKMQEAEIKHGRLAMVAITGFAAQEFVTRVGVVDETPVFFAPLSSLL